MAKTKVFKDEYKGNPVYGIWNVDEEGEKEGSYPIASMGKKKLEAVLDNAVELRELLEEIEL